MKQALEHRGALIVRRLRPDDLSRVVAIDAKLLGRERSKYFESVLQRNLRDTGVQVSLAAEQDDLFVGYLLARAWYGEFGTLEPYAVLESLGVHPDFHRGGVGAALLEQLVVNLNALGLTRLRTEVEWRDRDLVNFFHRAGFAPGPRLCLDLAWSSHDPRTSLSGR